MKSMIQNGKKDDFIKFIKRNISFAAFILLFLFFLVTASEKFFRLDNFQTIMEQTIDLLVVSLGMTFVILLGCIDLSVGSVLSLAGVIAASIQVKTGNTFLAILGGIAVGLACGLANGILHARLKIPSFIVTLGMLSIARSLTVIYTGGAVVMIPFESLYKKIGLYPWILIIGLVFIAIAYILQRFTIFGRYTKMIGGDETVAKLCGINVTRYKILVFAVCGIFTGIGGIILSARIGSGSPATGQGFELDAISAVVLGGTSQRGGIGGVRGTVIGSLTLSMLNNGLILLRIPSEVQLLVKGLVLILAVFISLERNKNDVIK